MDYWIKERDNPQIDAPYYVAYGKIPARAARLYEQTLYGPNTMLRFKTRAEYEKKLEELRAAGFKVLNG